jgi:hypothetical protein
MHARVKVLVRTFAMLADETQWAQGAGAVDRNGAPVRTNDRRAVAWCAVGALERAAGHDEELFESCLEYLQKASLHLFRCDPAVINDNTTHNGLIEMYARAIQLANRNRQFGPARPAYAPRRRTLARDGAMAQTHLRLVAAPAAAAAGAR